MRREPSGWPRTRADPTRRTCGWCWRAVASLAAVATALQRSGGTGPVAVATVLLSVLSVTRAGAMVNTVFALKYARMYYFDEPDRQGFDFDIDTAPAYSDFAYLGFPIGMAYAPSEARPTRRD